MSRAAVALAAGLAIAAGTAGAAEPPHAGTRELGVAGSLVATPGGRATLDVAVRGGVFLDAGGALANLEVEAGWTHVGELDVVETLLFAGWSAAGGERRVVPFLGVVAGVRPEWLGSFRETRWPLGAAAGVRVLAGERAAVRLEYRWLRILGDPVAGFDEHRLRAGISILFGD